MWQKQEQPEKPVEIQQDSNVPKYLNNATASAESATLGQNQNNNGSCIFVYIVGFGLVEMAISNNPKPTIYRNVYENTGPELAPVAETGSSHRLTAYKFMGHFFGLSYLNISGNNQGEKSFFRISNISVPWPHAQLRGRTVIQKLWTFFGPWGRDLSVTAIWNFSGKANTSIHGLGEDDTASPGSASLIHWL